MTISEMRNPLRKYVLISTLSAGAHEFIMVFAYTTSKTKVKTKPLLIYITISAQKHYVNSYSRRKLRKTIIDFMLLGSLLTIYGLVSKLRFYFLRKKDSFNQ